MPKIKTRRATAKRFRATASGRFKRASMGRRHILTKMTRKRKRQLRKGGFASPADEPAIRKQLPYL